MKRFILLFIIVLVGCNGLSSFVNRDGVGLNSAGSVLTNPTKTGGPTSTSNIPVTTMKDAYLGGKQNKFAKLIKPIYVIEEKDILNIKVRGEPDLGVTIRVAENGEIRMPLLEEVKVAGLTLQEAALFIQNRLKNGYLNDPIVTVEINTKEMLALSEKEVFVSGQVGKPGSIPLVGKYITVFDAINESGGLTELAWPSRTKLIRLDNGVKTVIKVNVKKIRKGERSLDIILKANDVIYVPETIF